MGTRYSVLIVGAGNIGAFYDKPGGDRVLTHAHAFSQHEGFNLLGFVDVYTQKAELAASLWGGKAFSKIEDAFDQEEVDVACVAVPDDAHYEVLKGLLQRPIKLILAEKPLAKTLAEANEIMDLYKEKAISLAINYSRRFIPEFDSLVTRIKSGQYGGYVTGTGYYGKGILHNGSHMIDLLRLIIGEVHHVVVVGRSFDFYRDDPSVSAVLTFEDKTPFFLQYVDCNSFSLFELDLFFEKGRVRIVDSGFKIEEYEIKESQIFEGYKNLTKANEINTGLGDALYHSAANIYNHLTKGEELRCSIEDGYKAMETCLRIGAQI